MNHLLFDLLTLGVVGLFAVLGWRRGLVLSLCGLLAFLVAFGGALFVSNRFSPDVSRIIQPAIQRQIDRVLEDSIQNTQISDVTVDVDTTDPGAASETAASLTLEDALAVLAQSKLFAGFYQSVQDAVREGAIQIATSASAAIASYLALQIARTVLFALTFLMIGLIWWLLSHVLDLACRLPVLRTLNGAGGFLFGAAKGALILLVVGWICSLLDIIPQETVSQTYLFRYFINFPVI